MNYLKHPDYAMLLARKIELRPTGAQKEYLNKACDTVSKYRAFVLTT